MTNDNWAFQLHTALQRLKESDIEYTKATANCAELRSIIHKQTNLSSSGTLVGSVEGARNDNQSREGGDRIPKKHRMKKSNETVISSPQQLQINQIQKIIKQYSKNNEEIEACSKQIINEKNQFLIKLEKSNAEIWKINEPKNSSLLEKLAMHLHET